MKKDQLFFHVIELMVCEILITYPNHKLIVFFKMSAQFNHLDGVCNISCRDSLRISYVQLDSCGTPSMKK